MATEAQGGMKQTGYGDIVPAGAPVPKYAPEPSPKTFSSRGEWAEFQRRRALGNAAPEGLAQDQAPSDAIDPNSGAGMVEGQTPEPEVVPEVTADGETPDPQSPSEDQGFEQYRHQQYRGHSITPPEALLVNSRLGVDEINAAAADVGIAARREGISAEGAQAIFSLIGGNYRPPEFGAFDAETALQQMYAACGEKTEEVVADLQGWVAKRPAVAALLEEGVQFGNHPGVLLTIGAIAQAAKGGLDITKPADAKVYAERILSDPNSDYWTGNGLHKMLVQGVQYALAVSEKKR